MLVQYSATCSVETILRLLSRISITEKIECHLSHEVIFRHLLKVLFCFGSLVFYKLLLIFANQDFPQSCRPLESLPFNGDITRVIDGFVCNYHS
jgi:hypothetical protein